MFIRRVHIRRLKRLRDLDLGFVNADGSPRMWTVLIGENGTCKSSVLQAIALAAAGSSLIGRLAQRVSSQLRDRRTSEPMRVEAAFGFQSLPPRARRQYPGRPHETNGIGLMSRVEILPDEVSARAVAWYDDAPTPPRDHDDPLVAARNRNLPLWFVAGYGVARALPDAGAQPRLEQAAADRLQTLFDSSIALAATAFANYFSDDKPKARMYSRVLKAVLKRTKELAPQIADIDLRGKGGVTRANTLQETARVTQRIGETELRLPMIALSHGYQSTIAWIADLVGHIVLEAEAELDPAEMLGLVLIDELDLYLHPNWQVALVAALRETFPRLQFVATTHSPLVTASMAPHEIVHLAFDLATGDVVRVDNDQDPRVLTGTEVYRAYFGLDDIHTNAVGQALREYRYLAANPFRTSADDRKLASLRRALQKQGIEANFEPVARRTGDA